MVDYSIEYTSDAGKKERIMCRGRACFSEFKAYVGTRHNIYEYDKDNGVNVRHSFAASNVRSFRYYPKFRSGLDGVTEIDAVLFLNEIKEATPELPWPRGNLQHWVRYGAPIAASVPGTVIVGMYTIIRYVEEYPHRINRYIKLRNKLGFEPLPSLFLCHFFYVSEDRNGWTAFQQGGDGHSIFGPEAFSTHAYQHFVNKKWAAILPTLKPYVEEPSYKGVHQLFGGVTYPEQWPALCIGKQYLQNNARISDAELQQGVNEWSVAK